MGWHAIKINLILVCSDNSYINNPVIFSLILCLCVYCFLFVCVGVYFIYTYIYTYIYIVVRMCQGDQTYHLCVYFSFQLVILSLEWAGVLGIVLLQVHQLLGWMGCSKVNLCCNEQVREIKGGTLVELSGCTPCGVRGDGGVEVKIPATLPFHSFLSLSLFYLFIYFSSYHITYNSFYHNLFILYSTGRFS